MRQEAHTRLLKLYGGKGNQGMEPPRLFVPHDMMSEGRCTICTKSFSNEESLKNHISDEHKAEVKKGFSKEALQVVTEEESYCEWLHAKAQIGAGQDQVKEMQKLQEQNKLLVEIADSQSKDTYIKVGDCGGVMNFQRTVLTPQENGTLKRTTLTQQYVNVTSRKLKQRGTEN